MSQEPSHGNGPLSSTNPSADTGPQPVPEDEVTLDIHEVIESALQRLADCGPLNHPDQLREMLPAESDAGHYVLIELIKLDMALAAEQNQIRRIEYYSQPLSDLLGAKPIPIDLVMEEFQLRKELGEAPSKMGVRPGGFPSSIPYWTGWWERPNRRWPLSTMVRFPNRRSVPKSMIS